MTEGIQDDEIDLLEYWNVLWRRKNLLISLVAFCVVITMVISLLSPNYYRSDTVIITSGPEAGGLGAALSSLPFVGALGGIGNIRPETDKIMVILKSRTLAEEVIRKFDLKRVFYKGQWDASKGAWKNPQKPPLMEDAVKLLSTKVADFSKSKEGAITISVEWKDRALAADIANYYVYALTEFLKDKSMNITVQVVDQAVPAERKSRPKIVMNMILAGVTSVFIGVFAAFFLEYLEKQRSQRA